MHLLPAPWCLYSCSIYNTLRLLALVDSLVLRETSVSTQTGEKPAREQLPHIKVREEIVEALGYNMLAATLSAWIQDSGSSWPCYLFPMPKKVG